MEEDHSCGPHEANYEGPLNEKLRRSKRLPDDCDEYGDKKKTAKFLMKWAV
jgi:hypothetical protein